MFILYRYAYLVYNALSCDRDEAITLFIFFWYFWKYFRKSISDFLIYIYIYTKVEEGLSKHDFQNNDSKIHFKPSPEAAPKTDSCQL